MLVLYNNVKKTDKDNFCKAIEAIPKITKSFTFYPFHNEGDFDQTIDVIEKTEPTVINDKKVKVALLTGESNIISMLPAIEIHAHIVILNDVNERVHLHTKFMLNCFRESKTINEFNKNYMINNPVIDQYTNEDYVKEELGSRSQSMSQIYFLSTEERYQRCKSALNRLVIVWTSVDFFNLEQCQLLSAALRDSNAIVTILNLTNLQHYDESNNLPKTLAHLLGFERDNKPFILYSTGFHANDRKALRSKVTQDIELYNHFLLESKKTQYAYSITAAAEINVHDINSLGNTQIIQQANDCIAKLSKQAGLDDGYMPTIKIESYLTLLFNNVKYHMVLCKGSGDDAVQLQKSEEIFLLLAKRLMPYWAATWYLNEKQLCINNKEIHPARVKEFIDKEHAALLHVQNK